MKHKLFIISIFFFISCNEKNEQAKIVKFSSFPEIVKVKTKTTPLRNVQASGLLLSNNYLVIKQAWIDRGYFLRFYDKNSLKFLKQTGKHGKGPSELSDPEFNSINKNKDKVYVVDQGRNRDVIEFDIKKSIQEKEYVPKKLFEIGNEREFVSSFIVAENDNFIIDYIQSSQDSANYLYTVLNSKGIIVDAFGEIPYKRNIPNMAYAEYTSKYTIYKNNKVISAFAYDDKIVCYDFKTKQKIFETDGPDLVETNVEVHSDMWVAIENKKTYTYKSITASEKYIYALYSGYSRTVYEKYVPYLLNNIFVFDFQGNPIKQLELDRPVIQITYDDEKNELICIQNDEKTGINTQGLVYVKLDDYGL